ncbi:MAG: S41 family peptidase [Cyanobacteria bacterium P01_A01_bin.114]
MMLGKGQIRLGLIAIATLIGLLLGLTLGSPLRPIFSAQPGLFETVWETIHDEFYDPDFNGVDWAALGKQYRPRVAQAASQADKAALINEMLEQLQTSHTHLYTTDEPAYYQLLGIFYPRISDLQSQLQERFPDGKIEYAGIGIVTAQSKGSNFIKAIFDGSPAAAAGLQVGDQILSVDNQPFQPIKSFLDKVDQPVTLTVQKSPNPGSQKEITVTPKLFDGITMFVDAMAESVDVVKKKGQQIGYIHAWSYASEDYQQQLEDELIYGHLKDADALVLDLRDGWGGAPLTALHPYTARGPSLTSIRRDGTASTYRGHWSKPVVMLVNEGSRSAKEILAYGFQQYEIGPVVGSPTPGAVVAGRAFLMPDDSLLYVAVADVYLDDQVRLEGVGVTPDVIVPFPLEHAQGVDPQKERAIALAVDLLTSQ